VPSVVHRSQNKYSKTMKIVLSVYIQKHRRSAVTLKIFDIRVIGYTYLRNNALTIADHFIT